MTCSEDVSEGARSAAPPLLVLRGGGAAALLAAYTRALSAAPFATKGASAAVVAVAADGIAQSLTRKGGEAWDWARTRWIVVWGVIFSGWANALWFDLLSRLFPEARHSGIALAQKVLVNQLVMAPALSAAFFAFTVLTRTPPPAQSSEAFDRFDLEKRGRIGYHELNVRALGFALSVWWAAKWAALRRKLAAELLPTLVRGNAYWTVVQTVNFRFVPPQCMVLFGNLASCVWTTYLCIVANRAAGDSPHEHGR